MSRYFLRYFTPLSPEAQDLADVAATGAGIVVVTNPGCQLQLAHGVARAGLSAEVVHLMELLDRAYGTPPAA